MVHLQKPELRNNFERFLDPLQLLQEPRNILRSKSTAFEASETCGNSEAYELSIVCNMFAEVLRTLMSCDNQLVLEDRKEMMKQCTSDMIQHVIHDRINKENASQALYHIAIILGINITPVLIASRFQFVFDLPYGCTPNHIRDHLNVNGRLKAIGIVYTHRIFGIIFFEATSYHEKSFGITLKGKYKRVLTIFDFSYWEEGPSNFIMNKEKLHDLSILNASVDESDTLNTTSSLSLPHMCERSDDATSCPIKEIRMHFKRLVRDYDDLIDQAIMTAYIKNMDRNRNLVQLQSLSCLDIEAAMFSYIVDAKIANRHVRSSRFVDMASEVLRLTIQGKLGSIESTVILHEFAVFLSLAPRNNIALTLLIVNGAKNSLRFREFFETFRSFGKIDAVSNITNQGVVLIRFNDEAATRRAMSISHSHVPRINVNGTLLTYRTVTEEIVNLFLTPITEDSANDGD